MSAYRKKPVVIEATQFRLGQQPYPEGVVAVILHEEAGMPTTVIGQYSRDHHTTFAGNLGFGISTLEGWHIVIDGDWIITGVKGERYPCKPDIFDATYDPA